MSIHDGRRQRQKERFLEYGLENFSDVEALELLLYYAIPRQDTNPIAHALLDKFHSFKGVMEARPEDLSSVAGIGESAATLLRLIPELSRRYLISERETGAVIGSSEDAGRLLMPYYACMRGETAYALCLDTRHSVINVVRLADGSTNRVDFSARKLVETALRENASAVIISHNHISGSALPSRTDIDATVQINEALRLIGVDLLDHIIVCDNDFVSMKDTGAM